MNGVDWDLLADHLGGALAGTPDDRRVAELVATDPEWSRAAERLATAMEAVAGDLRTLPVPVMPADLAARLEQMLHTGGTGPAGGVAGRASRLSRSLTDPPTRPPAGAGRTGGRPARRLGEPAAGPPGGPAAARPGPRRRRRALRWGSGLAAAAGVVAFAVVGVSHLSGLGGPDSGVVTASDGDGRAAPGEQGLALHGPELLASGSIYHRSDFTDRTTGPFGLGPQSDDRGTDPGMAEAPGPDAAPEAEGPPGADAAPGAQPVPAAVPGDLLHLWPLPAECVAAVQESFAPTLVTLDVADYAHFEGEPAVVIWITTIDGNRWVSIVGAGCGDRVAGADERHRVSLG